MKLHQVHLADVPATPWKNGGGVTRELLAWSAVHGAAAGDNWTLRVSVATIAASGPFSPFPGVRRWFAVLEGAGVQLQHAAESVALRAGDPPWVFDGTDAPGCTLLDSATRDLNLMVRGTRGAMHDVRRNPRLAGAWHWRALFVLQSATLSIDGVVAELPPGTLAWTNDAEPSTWECHAAPPGSFWLTLT